MKTIHRTIIVAKGPHLATDVYNAEFHVDNQTITVEDIQLEIDEVTAEPIYQEQLTQKLADGLGCVVVTYGTHSKFFTTCTAEPKTCG